MTPAISADPKTLVMDYTNWRGESARRSIVPTGQLRFGTTKWHPQPGWLLEAWDTSKGAMREFALLDCDFSMGQGPRLGSGVPTPSTSGQTAFHFYVESGSFKHYLATPTGRLLFETQEDNANPTWIADFIEVKSERFLRLPLSACDFVSPRTAKAA